MGCSANGRRRRIDSIYTKPNTDSTTCNYGALISNIYYTFRFRVVAILALYFLRKGRLEKKNAYYYLAFLMQ